jgi:hypothetical protein
LFTATPQAAVSENLPVVLDVVGCHGRVGHAVVDDGVHADGEKAPVTDIYGLDAN